MGMLGCGVQGQSHAEAFTDTFPLSRIMAYDKDPNRPPRYAEAMIRQPRGRGRRREDARARPCAGCDIVVTAGRS